MLYLLTDRQRSRVITMLRNGHTQVARKALRAMLIAADLTPDADLLDGALAALAGTL